MNDYAADDRPTLRPLEAITRAQRAVQRLLHAHPTLGPAIVLVVSIGVFMVIAPGFAELRNVSLVLQQTAVIGTLAVGQTLIILTSGIDLSVGSAMLITSIATASAATHAGLPGAIALLIGFATAILCGGANGFLIARFGLPAFITTLGTASVFLSLGLYFSSSRSIPVTDPVLMFPAVQIPVLGTSVTAGSLMMLLLYAAAAFMLRFTAYGRHIYAVGGDREAARLAGINVTRLIISVYAVAGAAYAVGAWLQMARIANASPQVGASYALDSITAVVIGGTSLFGGRGSIGGTLLGALIVTVFRNGLSIAGLDSLWQDFAIGLLIIIAVALDQWIRKVRP